MIIIIMLFKNANGNHDRDSWIDWDIKYSEY